MNDQNLVFLISQPRSGSTLTQRVLSAHSRIYSTAEPWLMLHPLYALRTKGIQTDYDARLAFNALQDLFTLLPNGRNDYLAAIKSFGLHLYEKLLEERKEDIFLDKTPRYYKIIPELIETYPQAKFIFLVRNPVAVLISIYKTWIGPQVNLLKHHRDDIFEALDKIWAGFLLAGRRGYMLTYENLTASPEKEIQKLSTFLDIKFEETMLDYSRASVGKGQMGDPVKIHKHSRVVSSYADSWKSKIDHPTLAFLVEEYLKHISPHIFRNFNYSYLDILLDVQLQTLSVPAPAKKDKRRLQQILGTHQQGTLAANSQVLTALNAFEEKLSPKIEEFTEEALLTWLPGHIPDVLALRTSQTYLAALVKLYKGNTTEAELLLQQVLKEDASFFKAAVQLAFLYWSEQKKSDAIKYMQYARNTAPGNHETLQACLQMWEQLNRDEEAFEERCRYYAWNPSDKENMNALLNILPAQAKADQVSLISDKLNRVQSILETNKQG